MTRRKLTTTIGKEKILIGERKTFRLGRDVAVAVLAGIIGSALAAIFGPWTWGRVLRNLDDPVLDVSSVQLKGIEIIFLIPVVATLLIWGTALLMGGIMPETPKELQRKYGTDRQRLGEEVAIAFKRDHPVRYVLQGTSMIIIIVPAIISVALSLTYLPLAAGLGWWPFSL